ncbi:YbaB/EbfC family nucleoid-associated protein [Membranicola marinus]|uniref:YbaB/EbfC family nucleoid-associated protein n=1 Tax=Membranihabitans marinus TaxID=1227546 RepID=A0A953HTT4_9BACT|nr:YbaB/EbfC family nucleoid-associated protein [Membranihabitans marinus]MBY5957753.1 YbaB/EbfC family nucleoid-associated protein [Membranihabitans marinus]
MLGNLFGNIEEQQEALQKKLEAIELESSVLDGAVVVKGNAKREILDIIIDDSKIDLSEVDQLQDLLVTAVNDLILMATEAEQTESQKLINDIMPPGLGGLFGK